MTNLTSDHPALRSYKLYKSPVSIVFHTIVKMELIWKITTQRNRHFALAYLLGTTRVSFIQLRELEPSIYGGQADLIKFTQSILYGEIAFSAKMECQAWNEK